MINKIKKIFKFSKNKVAAVATGVAVKVITSVLVGGLVLTGVYGVTKNVVIPKLSQKTTSLYDYGGIETTGGGSIGEGSQGETMGDCPVLNLGDPIPDGMQFTSNSVPITADTVIERREEEDGEILETFNLLDTMRSKGVSIAVPESGYYSVSGQPYPHYYQKRSTYLLAGTVTYGDFEYLISDNFNRIVPNCLTKLYASVLDSSATKNSLGVIYSGIYNANLIDCDITQNVISETPKIPNCVVSLYISGSNITQINSQGGDSMFPECCKYATLNMSKATSIPGCNEDSSLRSLAVSCDWVNFTGTVNNDEFLDTCHPAPICAHCGCSGDTYEDGRCQSCFMFSSVFPLCTLCGGEVEDNGFCTLCGHDNRFFPVCSSCGCSDGVTSDGNCPYCGLHNDETSIMAHYNKTEFFKNFSNQKYFTLKVSDCDNLDKLSNFLKESSVSLLTINNCNYNGSDLNYNFNLVSDCATNKLKFENCDFSSCLDNSYITVPSDVSLIMNNCTLNKTPNLEDDAYVEFNNCLINEVVGLPNNMDSLILTDCTVNQFLSLPKKLICFELVNTKGFTTLPVINNVTVDYDAAWEGYECYLVSLRLENNDITTYRFSNNYNFTFTDYSGEHTLVSGFLGENFSIKDKDKVFHLYGKTDKLKLFVDNSAEYCTNCTFYINDVLYIPAP